MKQFKQQFRELVEDHVDGPGRDQAPRMGGLVEHAFQELTEGCPGGPCRAVGKTAVDRRYGQTVISDCVYLLPLSEEDTEKASQVWGRHFHSIESMFSWPRVVALQTKIVSLKRGGTPGC